MNSITSGQSQMSHSLPHQSSLGSAGQLNSVQHLSNDWLMFSSSLNSAPFSARNPVGSLPDNVGSAPSASSFGPSSYPLTMGNTAGGMTPSSTGYQTANQWPHGNSCYPDGLAQPSRSSAPRTTLTTASQGKTKGSMAAPSHIIRANPQTSDRTQASRPVVDNGRPGEGRSIASGDNLVQAPSMRRHSSYQERAALSDPERSTNISAVSSLDYSTDFLLHGQRSQFALPPSLWMSPTSLSTSGIGFPPSFDSPLLMNSRTPASETGSSLHGPRSPLSADDSKSATSPTVFADDFFGTHGVSLSDHVLSPFPSPKISGSPDLKPVDPCGDHEQLAKADPLATQVWKMYTRTKATLPHAQRMENLSWRMMALALKKKKEDEESKALERAELQKSQSESRTSDPPPVSDEATNERGRRIDKGKARVRVVGFDGTSQDDVDDDK